MAKTKAQTYMDNIIQGMMPNINKQKKGIRDFMLQNALRTGQSMQDVSRAMTPYAEATGEAAARAGVQAERMGQQQEQFDVQQDNWLKQFQTGKEQWEKAFEQREEQQDIANMIAMFPQTGFTPQLMEALGYSGLDRSGMRTLGRQLGDIGFQNPQTNTATGGRDFGRNTEMLRERAMQPWQRFGGKAGQRQQTWLRNQFR